MDTLFLILMFITTLSTVATLIALIQYYIEGAKLGWVLSLASLTVSIAITSMIVFAMAKVFGWWAFAIFLVTVAQVGLTLWFCAHPELLDKPYYRVGGKSAHLR